MGRIAKIKNDSDPRMRKIAADLAGGALVVFPTETVYGLGANALDDFAVRRIFWAKGRPSYNPLLVHISNQKQLKKLVKKIPFKAKALMKRFWPGPLTIVFEKKTAVPDSVTAGLSTVGIRFPSHPIAQALIELSGVPVAAPSANIAGSPSATHARHAVSDLLKKVDWVIDSGPAEIGIESTIIDCTKKVPVLLRPGKISAEELQETIGKIAVHSKLKNKIPKAPGMKYRHYAPKAKVLVIESKKLAGKLKSVNGKVMVLTIRQKILVAKNRVVFQFASSDQMATDLFDCFRFADEKKIRLILVEKPSQKGIGAALLNRLEKASRKK